MTRPIAITTGEPAGVGPEICLRVAQDIPAPVVLIGDRDLLAHRGRSLGLSLPPASRPGAVKPRHPAILHVPLRTQSVAGRPDPANAPYVLETLDRALHGCLAGEFSAMVTAPVQKSTIIDAGVPFTGHTEYLAQRCAVGQVVMMLVGGGMRVALATTHLPLRAVPDAITAEGLTTTLRILDTDLRTRFGIARPRILVAGLNPHAGEDGKLGREEIEVIGPVLDELRREGMLLEGPLPADTLFQRRNLDRSDAVLAMYHDQGLAPLKHASFGEGVNVTLGLPIIRTSVDHGTALDLAGTGRANDGSMRAAVRLAVDLVGGTSRTTTPAATSDACRP
ncbi:MAG: 4-hydroxythreonine-4-phosphate dehydrogenase PdxA [Betaproteobacteria bacterium]|nr:4-hydroxythreonine-4-phosphate dehydrogenase PdxA [Betaproteobacteria bacterium]